MRSSRQKKRNTISEQRRLQFEQFEQRLVMSAQAVTSLLPELDIASPAITQQEVALPASSEFAAHDASEIAKQYGLDGSGQTVAVIDSGIAWDHYALGGGFGAGNKVVGGWDFAENDANPYDDGPAGFHGTHVAGIIGSTDNNYTGVSPGVDLVALRVFGDQAQSELAWVEQALQWVHENKDSFAHPITTVNLSLGTAWNSDTLPDWAVLEDELAQLKADGLFISVAAGNAFKSFGESGLSYPAVSEHVVPVASHDAQGNISDFSQRADGVLVAPGEMLRSTVPSHLVGNGTPFVGSTGTSMSAPYVAGASAILRQANEFMGVDNITQDLLYEQFRETADRIYDSVTGGYFYRINLDAALEAVINDAHGELAENATYAGVIQGGETITGTIGKISDVDAFNFVAQQTGKMTLRFEVTDDLVPLVDFVGTSAKIFNNEITVDVVAGQKYNFAVATADGSGHYRISIEMAEAQPGIDLGQVVDRTLSDQSVAGEATYRLTAVRDGLLTVQANANQLQAGAETLQIEIYDRSFKLVGSTNGTVSSDGELRLDIDAQAGQTYFAKVIGQSDDVDIRVSNLVSLVNGKLTVHGTNQADDVQFQTSDQLKLSVRGVIYKFDHVAVQSVDVIGHQGADSIDIQLDSGNDRVNTRTDGLRVRGASLNLDAKGFSNVSVDGGGGYDIVTMNDSVGDDHFSSGTADGSGEYMASLAGAGFQQTAQDFDVIFAASTSGQDSAHLGGTAGDEVLISNEIRNNFRLDGQTVLIDHFDMVNVDGGGGNDRANLNDSAGDDSFLLGSDSSLIENSGYSVRVNDFARVNAISTSGNDSVQLEDSAGNDSFYHRDSISVMRGQANQLDPATAYLNYAEGFDEVKATAREGNDEAKLFGTAGNDQFVGSGGDLKLTTGAKSVELTNFETVRVDAEQGGLDSATLRGTAGGDSATIGTNTVTIEHSNGKISHFTGVETTQLDLLAGLNRTRIIGSSASESLRAGAHEVEFKSPTQVVQVTGSKETAFKGNGGSDDVVFEELGDLDLLESLGDRATAYWQEHSVTAEEFDFLEARSVDNAIAEYDLEAVDYLYMLRGKWAKK